jgi:hypothetical protein
MWGTCDCARRLDLECLQSGSLFLGELNAIIIELSDALAATIVSLIFFVWMSVQHPLTQAPIIGMLTLPVTWKHQLKYGSANFAASYVR